MTCDLNGIGRAEHVFVIYTILCMTLDLGLRSYVDTVSRVVHRAQLGCEGTAAGLLALVCCRAVDMDGIKDTEVILVVVAGCCRAFKLCHSYDLLVFCGIAGFTLNIVCRSRCYIR